MKKITNLNIPLLIGIANLILVFATLVIIYASLGNPSAKLQTIYKLLVEYLKYSFIPALISIVLTKASTPKMPAINYILNIIYLIIYILAFLLISRIQLGV
ncbi:MAG: hypothetical protein BWY74_03120 [Firmicutes bacterium ADurb.Bin419]|nr:MAG: hypothetical protein BWY74_03120 [Firmicutes bacterium ADurb.Bin419]